MHGFARVRDWRLPEHAYHLAQVLLIPGRPVRGSLAVSLAGE